MTILTPAPVARPQASALLGAQTGLDEDRLAALARRFHEKALGDPLLGPIFAAHVRDPEAHLARMAGFWRSVALMSGDYHGPPVVAHLGLALGWAHFDRWLALFRETARETCPPEGAAHLIRRAERVALSLCRAAEGPGGAAPSGCPRGG